MGIETASFEEWKGSLDHSGHHAYEPLAYLCIERALKRLNLNANTDVLLDYGSGKGRAVITAARLPFRKVIGVDILDGLNQVARENICKDLQIISADASKYTVPHDVTVVYLYNPFFGEVMSAVQERLHASLLRSPRKLTILFLYPFNREDTFAQCDWLVQKQVIPEFWENVRLSIYEIRQSSSSDLRSAAPAGSPQPETTASS